MTVAPWRRAAVFALCLLAGGAAACGEKPAKPAPAAVVQNPVAEGELTTVRLTPDAVRRLGIATAVLDSGAVAAARTVGGEVVVPPGQALAVAAPVAGTVLAPEGASIPAPGARVAAGQPLLRLVALPPDRDLLRTGQDLATAAARLRQARAEAERVAVLYADRLVAGRDQERAQADLAAAQATYEAAAGQQRLLRGGVRRDAGTLGALTIAAPEAGVVRQVNAGAGQPVAAGAVLAEVVRLDRLWVRVPVYAGDAARVARGPATVHALGDPGTAPGGGPPLRAVPVAAPPSADPLAASVDLFYALDAGARLRPGERVGVTLPLAAGADPGGAGVGGGRALVVPLSAVVRDLSGGAWVYVQTDPTTFARRRVEVARVAGGRAVLARGPEPGARVVTAGAAELFGTEFGAGK